MTTKEEKARLVAIAGILRETAEELELICGVEITNLKELRAFTAKIEKQKEEFIAAKVKKEKPEPKEKDLKEGTVLQKIGDLNIGDEGITIEAEILEIETNSGKTKAGKPYKVTKIMLSDTSGPIKLVLWNEQTEQADGLELNDIIRVEAWKVEKGYKGGVFELVYGQFGTINKVNIERHII